MLLVLKEAWKSCWFRAWCGRLSPGDGRGVEEDCGCPLGLVCILVRLYV